MLGTTTARPPVHLIRPARAAVAPPRVPAPPPPSSSAAAPSTSIRLGTFSTAYALQLGPTDAAGTLVFENKRSAPFTVTLPAPAPAAAFELLPPPGAGAAFAVAPGACVAVAVRLRRSGAARGAVAEQVVIRVAAGEGSHAPAAQLTVALRAEPVRASCGPRRGAPTTHPHPTPLTRTTPTPYRRPWRT